MERNEGGGGSISRQHADTCVIYVDAVTFTFIFGFSFVFAFSSIISFAFVTEAVSHVVFFSTSY